MPSTTSGRKRSTMRRPATRAAGMRPGRARFFHAASRSRPRMLTVARSKPAAGTSCSSGPPLRPTSSREPSGVSPRNACATASAGYRCPPVPPPAINSLIRFSKYRSCPTAGDAEQHTHSRESRRDRRAAIAEERERHAGDGQRVGHRRHVQQRFKADPCRDRGRQANAEAIRGPQRGTVTAQREEEKSKHDQRRADQPSFLTQDRKYEVRVGLWKPAVLLDRVPDAHSKKTA